MRTLPLAALLLATALPLAAPVAAAAQQDRDKAVAGGGSLPAGWSARADGTAGLANVKATPAKDGVALTLGPAVIVWRPTDKANGPFHTLATFTQNKAPKHPEGYGLFVGGQALEGLGERYTYFLVRGDGTVLIKRRDGEKTTEVKPWTPARAVHKANARGVATNLLEIDHKQDPGKVVFKVNGTAVYSADAKTLDLTGIVGLRVNHNLDVAVTEFGLHQ